MQFEDLRLDESLLRAVRAAGYKSPTPIQVKAIPIVLSGRDVMGCAQTGTGKTAAFALPVLQRLSEATTNRDATRHKTNHRNGQTRSSRQRGCRHDKQMQRRYAGSAGRQVRGLVICPTRELAQQIDDSFTTYGTHTGLRTVAIYGGVNQNPQVRAVQSGADIIIATPGRLLDLMAQGYISLAQIEVLVLDEADRMLEMGFLPDIRRILDCIPTKRQSLLFSATMPRPIRSLANTMLDRPLSIEVARVSSPAETVAHQVYHVEKPQKDSLLLHLLALPAGCRTLIFTRTKRGADRLTRRLDRVGVRAAALHGDKSQGARTRALDAFRSARTPVLVATDLAARGLDVDDIAQVINYDMTPDPETYVHRIGRTGRAGATGTAISFCSADERDDLRMIERLLEAPLERAALPPAAQAASNTATGTGSTSRASSPARSGERSRSSRRQRTSNAASRKRSNSRPRKGRSNSDRRPKARRGRVSAN